MGVAAGHRRLTHMLGVPSTRDLRCHGGDGAVAVNAGVKIPKSGLGGLIRRRVRAGTGRALLWLSL